MVFTPFKLNVYLFFKLPSAFWCGVRAESISYTTCQSSVKYKWFNQNPFGSIYFAVLAMAAEFTTGVLVMQEIKKYDLKISMLVLNSTAHFSKKANGRIVFSCTEGEKIREVVKSVVKTNESKTIWLSSTGRDKMGDEVAQLKFEWTMKVK